MSYFIAGGDHCGIAGIISCNGNKVGSNRVSRMLSIMEHSEIFLMVYTKIMMKLD